MHGAPCNPDPRHVEIEESLLLDIVEALLLGLASSFGALLLVLEQASNGKQLQK